MSNITKRISKKVGLSNLTFPVEMYNNVYGSVVICGYIFNKPNKRPSEKHIIDIWKKTVKNKGKDITWSLDDDKFVDKTLKYFGMDRPENFPIAFVQSSLNCLFAPFINGEVCPLREDGFIGHTLATGRVYPLSFNDEVKENA